MRKPILKKGRVTTPINQKLDVLEGVHEKVAALQQAADGAVKEIRTGFVECVVVFIDLVDSTKFKLEHVDAPERWILRVRQFTEVLAEYVDELGGDVVKYIGDEVMASFTGENRVSNALSLLLRVDDIQTALGTLTRTPTAIKVVADMGPVYLLKYEDHGALDPQGTPVDRCARIAKFARAGTVLTSQAFAKESAGKVKWTPLGSADLKGIGPTAIYQLGDPTVSVATTVEISEKELLELRERVDSLTVREREVIEKNRRLQQQLEELGEAVSADDTVDDDGDDHDALWKKIEDGIRQLRHLIQAAPVPSGEYARFLFLSRSDTGQKYNAFDGRTFDTSIESKLVIQSGDLWELDVDHRRNQRAIEVMDQLRPLLKQYEAQRSDDDDELYEYSLTDPQFWSEKIGQNVS